MKKELKYMVINYSEADSEYIDYLLTSLDSKCEEIVEFFGVEEFGKKINVILYSDLEEFRKAVSEEQVSMGEEATVQDWVCGTQLNGNIRTLCLRELRRSQGHEDESINDLLYLLLHEFVHGTHEKLVGEDMEHYAWLSEGLATTISGQYDNEEFSFKSMDMKRLIDGGANYNYYHTMFSYVLDTYGKEYIFRLIKDYEFLKEQTPLLYE